MFTLNPRGLAILSYRRKSEIRDFILNADQFYLLCSPLQLLRDGGTQIGVGDRRRPGDILARCRVCGCRSLRRFAGNAGRSATGRRSIRNGGCRLAG